MIVGVALLIYVASEYGTMYSRQRSLAEQWQQQQLAASTPGARLVRVNDGLTRLSIPKIHLDDIVVEGTSHKDLLVGPGHLAGTPLPGLSGNSVISAHRDTFFRHIYELNEGDTILVERAGQVFRYEVTGKRIVQPDDVSVIASSKDPRLTLLTCYPTYYIGPAPERLVVFSHLVDSKPDLQVKPTGSGTN